MTNEEKLVLIKQLIEHRKNIDEFGDKFKLLFGSYPGNSECGYEVFERLFGDYTRLVADKLGDTECGLTGLFGTMTAVKRQCKQD